MSCNRLEEKEKQLRAEVEKLLAQPMPPRTLCMAKEIGETI